MPALRPGWAALCALLAVVGAVGLVLIEPAAPASAATFTVTSTADASDTNPGDGVCASAPSIVCTLRAAIEEANALGSADTINLPSGTYVLAAGPLNPLFDLTINGAGADTTIVDA